MTTRFSYMVIDTPTMFADEASTRSCFELVKSCGYEGLELNITPALLDLAKLRYSCAIHLLRGQLRSRRRRCAGHI